MDLEEAKALYLDKIDDLLQRRLSEVIPTRHALHRVIAYPIYAKRSVPFFPSAAMDGIAIDSKTSIGAFEHQPLLLKPDDYLEVDTGDPILDPFDAVIPAEDCIQTEQGIQIIRSVTPWENVRPIGEDIVEGELLFVADHQLRPMDISVLIAAQLLNISVIKRAVVAILPTGTELKDASADLEVGDIVESNSYLFEGLCNESGSDAKTYPITADDYSLLIQRVHEACERFDVVLVNAGSSAGREDYTAQVIQELGEVFVHGIAIKPGKPAILGRVYNSIVIGIPGFPVSAHIIFEEFVSPILLRLNHLPTKVRPQLEAKVTRRIVSSLKSKEYVRVKLGKVNDQIVATPLSRGAGMMMSVVKSDGYALIDKNQEGIEANSHVKVLLNQEISYLDTSLMAIGSHDVIMDLLNNLMNQQVPPCQVSSVHVGSYSGLLALQKGESHLAMTHLLEADGSYNKDSVTAVLEASSIVCIKAVQRTQGLIVQKGNPLKLKGLKDIHKTRFVNRQRGAGTRVFLDYSLKRLNIEPAQIRGYDKELNTHLAVASSVKNNLVDCGLGVQSAAVIMGCDFIPLGEESYDFIIRKDFLDDPRIQSLIKILKSDQFALECSNLGGYDTSHSGEIMYYER